MCVIALVIVITSCASRKSTVTPAQMAQYPIQKDVLAAGDAVEIKFSYTPQYNDTQTIHPEGTLSLPLVGEVAARGKTPPELREELIRLYSPLLKKPDITVIVRKQVEQRVYVGGEVNKAGQIDLTGRMTALEAIMVAGGFNTVTATTRNVVIVRHKGNERYGCSLDLRDELDGKKVDPFYLESQDIVYVPRSTINKVNQWVDQYINKLIPQSGFIFATPVGKASLTIDTSAGRTVPR